MARFHRLKGVTSRNVSLGRERGRDRFKEARRERKGGMDGFAVTMKRWYIIYFYTAITMINAGAWTMGYVKNVDMNIGGQNGATASYGTGFSFRHD